MAHEDIGQSARFVSVDTHPANNSLVITYEVPVDSAVSNIGRAPTATRTKRDQLQVNIPALDKLTKSDVSRAGGAAPLDLHQLGQEVLRECPMLLTDGDSAKTLEDIQLNLLYLFNRRQAQPMQSTMPSRPPSSTRASASGRLSSARAGSAAQRIRSDTSGPLDIYTRLCDKHLAMTSGRVSHPDLQLLKEFEQQLDAHLRECELEFQMDRVAKIQLDDLELQLEGLYGDQEERRKSIAIIRRFIQDSEEKLALASSHRLLFCAMLRILRDSDGVQDHYLHKSILYCMIRFTSLEESLCRAASLPSSSSANSGDGWQDLLRVVLDSLEKQTQWLAKCDDLRQVNASNHTNTLLVLLCNLIRELPSQNKLKRALVLQQGAAVADILVGQLEVLAKHLARDTRTQPRTDRQHERLIVTLRLVLSLALRLVQYKEFILVLRAIPRAQALINSTISLISTLQLCRPGSGTAQQQQQQHQVPISDKAVLLDLYELELEALKLITSLTYDSRLRTRLVRKSLLLKCVLRNLVVFLAASRKSNTLSPFDRSPVLMVPFKCLYELSCSDKIKCELFRSKIIMKCLLEYLLSSATDLATEQEVGKSGRDQTPPLSARNSLDLHVNDQIVLEPHSAGHFVLGLWINLAARGGAPIYHLCESNEELREPLCDYLQLVASLLEAFTQRLGSKERSEPGRGLHLSVYIHAKLLRNLSQYLEFSPSDVLLSTLAQSAHLLLAQALAGRCQEFAPLLVENLASLANFVDTREPVCDNDDDGEHQDGRLYLGTVLKQLFGEQGFLSHSLGSDAEAENDDLLLVAVNLLGAAARNREICAELKSISWSLASLMSALIELKQTDTEMLVSCLFTTRQLMNHASFLQELGSSLERESEERGCPRPLLVDALCSLVMHPDGAVAKLANAILMMLKQFEELRSLSESVTCQRRFAAYNSRWLAAIRANRDEPSESLADSDQPFEEVHESHLDRERDASQRQLDDEYTQLRTINDAGDTQSTSSSSRLGTASSHSTAQLGGKRVKDQGPGGGGDESDKSEEDEEEEEEEEETFSEPDLNVIDANSMIKHLTNRREFRSELLQRR